MPGDRAGLREAGYRRNRRVKREGSDEQQLHLGATCRANLACSCHGHDVRAVLVQDSSARQRQAGNASEPQKRGTHRVWTLRCLGLAFSLALAELLLQIACLGSTRVRSALAPADSAEARAAQVNAIVADDYLGHCGNPAYPGHDRNGFHNASVPATAEIVTIGDSQTYGLSVAPEQAWPHQLALRTGLSVYNMGLGGWGPVQYSAILDEALRYRPRLIIVGFYYGNDLVDSMQAARRYGCGARWRALASTEAIERAEQAEPLAQHLDAMLRSIWEPCGASANGTASGSAHAAQAGDAGARGIRGVLSSHSRLYGVVRAARRVGTPAPRSDEWTDAQKWARFSAAARAAPESASLLERPDVRTVLTGPMRCVATDLNDPRVATGLAIALGAMDEMAARAARAGCRLLVVHIPTKETVLAPFAEPVQQHVGLSSLLRNEAEARARARRFLQSRGIEDIDATEALQSRVGPGRAAPYPLSADGHPTRAGHAAIAAAVAPYVTAARTGGAS